jgi:hypothetical protein
MKLLFENWRKFLKESYTDWGSVDLDQWSEDDLYDLEYEDLKELEDYIESYSQIGRQSTVDPNDLLSTVKARIEAIEESDMEDIHTPDREIEDLYDGEFAMRLLKAYFSSANAGIELASMIPGAESLSKEFRRIRDHVPRLIKYAEDGDNYPWATLDETEDHPDALIQSVIMLLRQMMGTAWESEMDEEQKEVIAGYHNWADSIANLRDYAYYNLHPKTPAQRSTQQSALRLPSLGYEKYEHAYEFISKWVGGEIE